MSEQTAPGSYYWLHNSIRDRALDKSHIQENIFFLCKKHILLVDSMSQSSMY